MTNAKNSIIDVFVEISIGKSIKYEFDRKRGRLVVDRFLHTSMHYPFNYGFIPNTQSEDNDPLDVLVLTLEEILPGTILPSRIVGMLETEDETGIDIKLIAVPADFVDPESYKVQDVLDLTQPTKDRIRHFFEYYKSLEKGKWVEVKKWHGKEKALEYLQKSYLKE